MTTQFKYLLVDEEGSITGTNSKDVAQTAQEVLDYQFVEASEIQKFNTDLLNDEDVDDGPFSLQSLDLN